MIEQFILDNHLKRCAWPAPRSAPSAAAIASSASPTRYTARAIGTVPKATLEEVRAHLRHRRMPTSRRLTRFERAAILNKAARWCASAPLDEVAALITRRIGPVHEGRGLRGRPRQRRVAVRRQRGAQATTARSSPATSRRTARSAGCITQREPLLGVIRAITPFNHPMNQVAHKVVPARRDQQPHGAQAVGEGAVLGPAAGRHALRGRPAAARCSACVTGDPREIADELITNPHARPDHLHRRRGDRQVHRRQGRLPAHGARARRQRSADRDGRRRPRRGLVAGGGGLVQELGPALHGGQAHAGARGGRRRASSSRWSAKTRAWSYGDPSDPKRGHGHRDRRGRGAAVRVARQRGRGAGRAGCWWATSATAPCTRRPWSTGCDPR